MKEAIFIALGFLLCFFIYKHYPQVMLGIGIGALAAEWFYHDRFPAIRRRNQPQK